MRCISAALFLWLLSSTALALDVPILVARVNDYGGMLSPATEAQIEATLESLERDKGSQVVVLTIPSLEDEVLEDYSLRVAETWELGRGDQDDGALLLIVRDDRKMRLEVGYGLEPVITDAMSRRILDGVLKPQFRAGNFDGGVERGVEAIDGLVRGTSSLPPPSASAGDDVAPTMFGVFWLLFLMPFISGVLRTNPFQWMLYLLLAPFMFAGGTASAGPNAAPAFLLAWLVGAPLIWSFFGRRQKKRTVRRRRSGGVFPGGAWSSGTGWGGGGWSGGGGGFSGGGGGFGGGGSSSGW